MPYISNCWGGTHRASEETYQRRHERRRGVEDFLTARQIACQAGNETVAEMLEAAVLAAFEPIAKGRRDPVRRSRLVVVAMNDFDEAFNAGPAH